MFSKYYISTSTHFYLQVTMYPRPSIFNADKTEKETLKGQQRMVSVDEVVLMVDYH